MDRQELDFWGEDLLGGMVRLFGKKEFPRIIRQIEGEIVLTLHSDASMPYIGKITPLDEERYKMEDSIGKSCFYSQSTLESIFISKHSKKISYGATYIVTNVGRLKKEVGE